MGDEGSSAQLLQPGNRSLGAVPDFAGTMKPFDMIGTRITNKAALVLTLALPLLVGACAGDGLGGPTASLGTLSSVPPPNDQGMRQFTEQWGRRFDADPGDKTSAINYARGLRALTEYAQAVAVLQQAAVRHPDDLEILGAYGKALADDGRLAQAAVVLSHAHTPARPNWSILSAQGVVADEMGDHAEAQDYYRAALKIAPGEPSVLSNLGLSYALDKRLDLADETLRQAVASPRADARVRRNFALVLSLEGKSGEAQALQAEVASAAPAANLAPPHQAAAAADGRHSIEKPGDAAQPLATSLAARD